MKKKIAILALIVFISALSFFAGKSYSYMREYSRRSSAASPFPVIGGYATNKAEWEKRYKYFSPRIQITDVSSKGWVNVVVYLPRVEFRTVFFYVGSKTITGTSGGQFGKKPGTVDLTLYLPSRQNTGKEPLPDGRHSIRVVETTSGDMDEREILVKNGVYSLLPDKD